MSASIPESEARKRLEERGFRLVGGYINVSSKADMICPKCGSLFSALPTSVFNGNTQSCGCHRIAVMKSRVHVHITEPSENTKRRLLEKGFEIVGEYRGYRHKVTLRHSCGAIAEVKSINYIVSESTGRCASCKRRQDNSL